MSAVSVLYVEDDEVDVFLMDRAWRGVRLVNPLHVVHDGQEAMDYLSGEGRFADRGVHPIPGLVLLDLKLPKIHGLQLLKWIREQPLTRTLRVIILSASNQERDMTDAEALGITDYWVKSGEPGELPKMIAGLKGLLSL